VGDSFALPPARRDGQERDVMSETYAPGGYERDRMDRAGGVLLVAISILAGILVIAGLIYATGTNARHNAAVLAAGCEPTLFYPALPCTTQQMVISQYQAIVNPATKLLTADAAAYTASETHHLVAAEAALTSAAATVQALDNSLAAFMFTPQNRARALSLITGSEMIGGSVPAAAVTFTPQMTAVAGGLVRANQAFAKLLAEQARSSSLTQLRSFNPRADAASAAVQTEIKLLHKAVVAPLT
jgi:hypothetical protein